MTTKVRTRIAPSPTGPCHLGTARTALFNYLFAKHHGGTFIFRLEDTDRERSTKESEQELYDSLHWLGLDWDEGPDMGGKCAPYRQSERGERHRAAIEKLLESGHAYRCFCTPEQLEAVRKQQMEKKELVHYAGTCRALSPDEITANMDAGKPFAVRFKMPDEAFTFTDIIRGEVTVEGREIADFVIARPDGSPIFHLTNVVDDAAMGITHVIRGEDHLPNVPKHIALFRALGNEPPLYAHLPLILNPDGSKMSKRKMVEGLEPYVRVFREKGYLPEAMVSYLALLGWSPGAEEAILTLSELVERFSLDGVSKSGARFDVKKLNAFNGHYWRTLPEDRLVDELSPRFAGVPRPVLRVVVALLRERVVTTSDASKYKDVLFAELEAFRPYLEKAYPYLGEDQALTEYCEREEFLAYSGGYDPTDLILRKRHTARGSATIISQVLELLEKLRDDQFTATEIEAAIRAIGERYTWKSRHVFMVIRVAVTGRKATPPLPRTMEVIGKRRCVERLRFALKKLAEMGAEPWPMQ